MPVVSKIDVSAMLNKGAYYVLDNYAQKEMIYPKAVNAFLEGIEELEGRSCRDRVAEDGLGQMHKHFPVDKVCLLEEKFLKKMRTDLYYWSYRVGAENLGLTDAFHVDYLIIIRIHYPYVIARKAKKDVVAPRLPAAEKVRLMSAAMKNWRLLGNMVGKAIKFRASGNGQDVANAFDVEKYHKDLPVPALSHGPHVDTWYGHSYDGVNLWWSIDGVNEDNTVILYPELFGQKLPFDPKNMYIAPGFQLTKPHKITPRSGELLVFNPETLHGTQVNISDSTRVVVSTRLNPETPRFDVNAPFHFEHWFSSQDLERKKFSKLHVFPKKRYVGSPRIVASEQTFEETPRPVFVPEKLSGDQAVPICDSSALIRGKRMAVDLINAKLMFYRNADGLQCFSRICPHLGMDLADGFQERDQTFCPGHGIQFSLQDGSSRCRAFRLRQYRAMEKDGKIYVQLSSEKSLYLEVEAPNAP